MYMYHIVRCEIFLFPFTSLIPFFLYKVLIYDEHDTNILHIYISTFYITNFSFFFDIPFYKK